MWWILQTVVFSIFFITIIHYLYLFLMNNLTTPIVKDLVHTPSNKYENMFQIINNSNSNMVQSDSNSTPINNLKYDLSDLIPNDATQMPPNNMKDELKSFLQEQLND
jgi:hypothetical protein